MAYDLGRNLDSEIERTILLKTLTPAQVEELFPPYPKDLPVILPEFQMQSFDDAQQERRKDVERENVFVSAKFPIASALESINTPRKALEQLLGSTGVGIGSNSWVISGQRTTTGKPILANDPHLNVQMPSIWYEVGLHCTPKGADCPYNVTGFSFAGMLGVIVGHSDRHTPDFIEYI